MAEFTVYLLIFRKPLILFVTKSSLNVCRNCLNAKLTCHRARYLLPVEIIERSGLATGPATVKLLSYCLALLTR